jgi:hypothetical protein
MKKKLYLTIIFICMSVSQALAAQWGVLPLPKNALQARPEDMAEAIAKVQAIGANLYVNISGWHDLEPEKEVYDLLNRLGGFSYGAQQGMTPYFGVSVINTVKRDMPDDLLNTEWTNPVLLQRFSALMEAASKKLPAQIPYFIIGNEVDVYFEKHPDEMDAYLTFYEGAKRIVQSYYPSARIGMSVTFEGIQNKTRETIISRIIQSSDAAFFTFYPVYGLPLMPVSDTPALLDTLIDASQNKEVILQEVGYPSTEKAGSSEARQAEFFQTIIPAINARPRITVASIFLLHDLEPKLCDMLTGYYGFSNDSLIHDFLCTLGVHDFQGNPKPAWNAIVHALKPS